MKGSLMINRMMYRNCSRTWPKKKPFRFLRTRPSLGTGLMRHTTLTSPMQDELVELLRAVQNINCFNSTAVLMNKLIE